MPEPKKDKTKQNVLILSILLGVWAWLLDTSLVFYDSAGASYMETLITRVPFHDIHMRMHLLGAFVVFGLIVSRSIAKREKTEEELQKVRKELERRVVERTTQLQEKSNQLEDRVKTELQKRKTQDQILLRQSKLAAMGDMVGAIAHQWRQPLSTISIILQRLRRAYKVDKFSAELLEESTTEALERVKYMSSTLDDFRNYFAPGKARETFRVVEAIKETIALMRAQLENHRIAVHLDDEKNASFQAAGCGSEFKLVLVNIVKNAKNAITCRREKNPKERNRGDIFFHVTALDDKISIKIANNGCQIPDNILGKIFEPYFAPRDDGKVTGIGLFISKMIIENQMGGSISTRSDSEGTEFAIELRKKS